jgi:DNA-binding PadR family transcriptional regulator
MKQTDYVILGLLSEAPMTGYTIKRLIDIRFKFFWNESYGQLYPELRALCAASYIGEAESAHRSSSARAKKTYALLPRGMEALRAWLAQPVEKESVRLEILLKMYFSHLAGADIMLGHVREFRAAHEADLHTLEAFEKELKAIERDDPAHPAILRVIDFGLKANCAYLDWCAETENYLKGRRD